MWVLSNVLLKSTIPMQVSDQYTDKGYVSVDFLDRKLCCHLHSISCSSKCVMILLTSICSIYFEHIHVSDTGL